MKENPSAESPLSKLSPKHRRFVYEYMNCRMNASEAARRCGYAVSRANRTGYELVSNRDIKAAINYLGEELCMTAGEGVRRMSQWAAGTMDPFMNEAGLLVLDSEDAMEHRHLIKKVKQKKTVITMPDGTLSTEYWTEIELHDAKDATDKVLQLHGRYKQLPGDLGNDAPISVYLLPDGTSIKF